MHTVTIGGTVFEFDASSYPPYLATLHTACKEHGFYPTCKKIEAIYDKLPPVGQMQMKKRRFMKCAVEQEIEFVK